MTVLAAAGVGGCGVLTGHTQLVHKPGSATPSDATACRCSESTYLLPSPRKPSTHGMGKPWLVCRISSLGQQTASQPLWRPSCVHVASDCCQPEEFSRCKCLSDNCARPVRTEALMPATMPCTSLMGRTHWQRCVLHQTA